MLLYVRPRSERSISIQDSACMEMDRVEST